jgi:drug/metabolite transporter (DMT)-like permease
LIGAGVVLLASLGWASGSVYANRNPIKTTTSMASGMQMLAGGSLLLLLALGTGDYKAIEFGPGVVGFDRCVCLSDHLRFVGKFYCL